ncbi:MAG TPA: hypothetical protein VGT06_02330, partial [Candidatus Methylomirabilis sp.]|nr:hypothetical protein [Candidatus Methylomirabilis sp.]
MWKSSREVDESLKTRPDLKRLERLYWLSQFWNNVVYPEGYVADGSWTQLLVPTEYGEILTSRVQRVRDATPEADFLLSLFCVFAYHELVFDWQVSAVEGVLALLKQELLGGRVRLPHRLGRLLYDRFNDLNQSNRTDHLMPPEVQGLLEGTPQGVFQLGPYISGPLGILESAESRWIPPTLQLPLWHCSDTGCAALHDVQLVRPNIPIVKAYDEILHALHDEFGPASEWDS